MRNLLSTLAAMFALVLPASAQEMRSFTDDLGRTVEIPTDPQRIIGLWDWVITTPLIELGAPVVGSHGRVRDDGSTYIRPANVILGVSFDNSDITFTGAWQQFDFEVMAELQPDLLIARTRDQDLLEKLEPIGPVVFVDTNQVPIDYYRTIADIVGELDQFEERKSMFQTLLEDAKSWVGETGFTYSIVQASGDGQLNIYGHYGMKDYILDAIGFEMVGEGAEVRKSGENRVTVSPEALPAQNADFVFGNYRVDKGAEDGPRHQLGLFDEMIPDFCDYLPACAEGRMILLPREHAIAPSFQAWELLTHAIVSQISGRPGIKTPN